jgi:hypothetical protein
MQLDEFVSETMKAIIKGVKDSQEFAKANRAVVNPRIPGPSGRPNLIRIESDEYNSVISHRIRRCGNCILQTGVWS